MAITPVSVAALTGTMLAGKTLWGPITPPLGAVAIQVAIDRAGLALLTQPISWDTELSIDAGQTYRPLGGASTVAGQALDINLNVYTESSFTIKLPAPADANTRVRGSITVGETVVTTLTVRHS